MRTCFSCIPAKNYHVELIDPVTRVVGEMAYSAYTLHLAQINDDGKETIHTENVTRIFQQEAGAWKMIHFHRSLP
jgi:ketosteroid isomerase-like protein